MGNYRKIEFEAGEGIESAIKHLNSFKQRGELVCGSFNGNMLYSDIDDVDSAYIKITGKSKSDFDAELKEENDRYQEKKRKHEEYIPKLTKDWIEKGNNVLDDKYKALWAECVPIRLKDLYMGMELGMCLDIVSALNNGCSFEEAKSIIDNQGHSGMSFSLVCSMVKSFCDRGSEFVLYAKR